MSTPAHDTQPNDTATVQVTLERTALAAIACVTADRCTVLAALLDDRKTATTPAIRRYAQHLAAATDALLNQLPADTVSDLRDDVNALHAALTATDLTTA